MTTVEAPINDEDPSASVSPAERDFSQSPAWKNGKQQLYPEANHERSAVVLALFGPTVGPCVGDFATTYNRVNGRLYASTKAILFYSNLFGFERRLCLQLSDVEGIESYRSTSIRISMVDCEDRVFKKFPSRDVVLGVLKELLWKYSGGRIAQESNRLLPLSTNILSEDDRSDDDEESEPLRPHLSSDPEVSEQLSHLSTRRPRSQSVPHLRSPLSSQDSKPPPPPPPRAQSIISIENKPDEQTEHPTPVDYVPSEHRKILLGEISTGPTANFDIEKAWNKAKQHFDDFALEVSARKRYNLPK